VNLRPIEPETVLASVKTPLRGWRWRWRTKSWPKPRAWPGQKNGASTEQKNWS
jgi:hypothetical protein